MEETVPTPERPNVSRGANGRFRRDLEHVERDAEACRLAARGLSYSEIAARLGYSDRGTAHKAVQRVMWETARQHGTEELRQRQLAEITELRRSLWPRITDPPPSVDRLGRVVRGDDGEEVPDVAAQAAAAAVVLRAQEREARLLGLDAPKRSLRMSGPASIGDIVAFVESLNPADFSAAVAEMRRRVEAAAAETDPHLVRGSLEHAEPGTVTGGQDND